MGFSAIAYRRLWAFIQRFVASIMLVYIVHLAGNYNSGIQNMQQHSSESIFQRLKAAREQAGVTLTQLAERTGYAITTLSGVENEHDQPSKRLLSRWIEALAISESWLKTGQGEMFSRHVPKHIREQRSDLAAPIRSRIQTARQHATDLLKELDQIEQDLADTDAPAKSSKQR
jgi:transcriptional regulator with XRE-family HTH domain